MSRGLAFLLSAARRKFQLNEMEYSELPRAAPISDGPKLRRELTLIDALSLVVGMTVGSGIFTTPGVVLAKAGSVGEGLVAWIVTGAVALCSTLLYTELGTSMPVASGDAQFLKTAFGPSWAFAFIWTSFVVLSPGGISIVSTSIAQYFVSAIAQGDTIVHELDGDGWVKYVAISCVVALTVCNCAGVRFGSFLQNLLSLCKTSLILLIMVVAVVFLTRDTTVLRSNFSKPFAGSSLSGFGPSMVAALWAFSGLTSIVFLTEELKNPSKDVPRGTLGGTIIVITIYHFERMESWKGRLAWRGSYDKVLHINKILDNTRKKIACDIRTSAIVAMDSIKAVLGQQAGSFTAILVAISMLGNVNAAILCGGRYLFSAARDGHFYGGCLGQLSQSNSAPIAALMAQGAWCVLLLLWSSDLPKLLNYFSIASYFFSGLTAIAHWKLRYQFPDLPRPFRVPLHPCLNIVVICLSTYMITTSVLADPLPTILSLSFILSSFPLYYVFVKKRHTQAPFYNENTALLS